MSRSMNQIEAWDAHYESSNMMLIPDIRVIRWASSILNEKPQLRDSFALDLGCGNGRHSIALAKMGMNVTAVDYSPNAISSLKMWAKIERLENRIEAYELNLADDCALTDLRESIDVCLNDMVLCWGVLEYFDDNNVLRILDEAGYMAWENAKLLLMARGPKDFCYNSPERSDGFMDLFLRDQQDWETLVKKQEDWGGEVEIDSRMETFGNIVVGGVKGDKIEHMIFIEAQKLP